jgi:glycosyltransferase involved in cell wall biosynthesis
MAAGTPVIVARRAALPEVAGDAGILVDPSQPEQIADIALELDNDDVFRDQIVAKGRQRAKLFSWDACVNRLVSALEEFSPPAMSSRTQ